MSVQRARTYILKLTTDRVVTNVIDDSQKQMLVLNVSPPNAEISISGIRETPNFQGQLKKELSFGTYSYRVTADKYHPVEGTITINDPVNQHVLNVSLKQAFVDTPSYNKALLRTKYFKKYNAYRLEQSAKIRDCEKQLRDANDELQRQKSEQANLLTQEKRHRDQLTKEQRQKEASVKQSKANEKQLTSQLSKKEAQKRKLQQQIQRLIDEEVRKAAAAKAAAKAAAAKTSSKGSGTKPAAGKSGSTATPSAPTEPTVTDKTLAEEAALSNDFASNKGKLAWPVAYTSIARNYGIYTHESGGQNMNNGIDLVTVQGTNVYAVFKGKVTSVFTCPNGTQGVIIRHGDYMTVYANLASLSVKKGQSVSTRATIGTVASDGAGHGEFSFQLWKGRESQNPRSWLR